MIAAVILAASQHVAMIVVGRIFQGIAVSVCASYQLLVLCSAQAMLSAL